ncbi:Uncharacterised protein g10089 [Pycnogonum litorale]
MEQSNTDSLDYNVGWPEVPIAENIIQENETRGNISDGVKHEALTNRLKAVALLLCLSQLFVSMGFAVLSVFFPDYAFHRGLDESDVGFIFASYFTATVVFSPAVGLTISHFGTRNTLIGSYCLSALVLVAFSLCEYLPNGRWLFWSCTVLRFLQGIGFVGASTATFTIVANEFPRHLGRMTGYLETAQASGYSVAAFLGGVMYHYGGFSLPFYVLAGCYVVVVILCWFFIPANNCHLVERPTVREMCKMLTRPSMYFPSFICAMLFVQISIYATYMAPMLQTVYHWNEMFTGLSFSLVAVGYAIGASVVGYLIDKTGFLHLWIIIGTIMRCFSNLLIGPTPIFGLEPTTGIAIACLVIISICGGFQYIPIFSLFKMHSILANFPENFHTSCLASTLMAFSSGIGAVLGPIMCGQLIEKFGYQLSLNIVGYITMSVPVICAIDWLWTWYVARKTSASSDEERTRLIVNEDHTG